jgi:transcriptional regulator with XRE-family HTH domain
MDDQSEELNRIKEILFFQKKSQRWLAGELGISTTAMTAICNNKSQPHLKDLRRIAAILNVDIRELLHPTKKQ